MKKLFILTLLALFLPEAKAQMLTLRLTETVPDKEWRLSLGLTSNDDEASTTAFSMDISLPAGISFVEDSLKSGARLPDHLLSCHTAEDGILSVAAFSPTNAAFTGTTGGLLLGTLRMPEQLEAGRYSLRVSNVKYARRNGSEYNGSGASATLKVEATGICTIVTDPVENGDAYGIDGRRVNGNAAGVIIVNGKKVLKMQ